MMTRIFVPLLCCLLQANFASAQRSAPPPSCPRSIQVNPDRTTPNQYTIILSDSTPAPLVDNLGMPLAAPRLVAFYTLGDSSYYRRMLVVNSNGCHVDTLVHQFDMGVSASTSSRTIQVNLSYSALYSPDRPPKLNSVATVPSTGLGSPYAFSTWTAFANMADTLVNIEPQYPRSRPGDTITVALSFRAPAGDPDNSNQTPPDFNGELLLYDPTDTTYTVLSSGATLVQRGAYKWPVADLKAGSQRTFFVQIRVNPNIVVDSNMIQDRPLQAFLLMEGKRIISIPKMVKSSGSNDEASTDYGNNLYDVPIGTSTVVGSYEKPMSVAAALDPNDIIYVPHDCWDTRQTPAQLNTTVKFFNSGNEGASRVSVETRLKSDIFKLHRSNFSFSLLNSTAIQLDSQLFGTVFQDVFTRPGGDVLSSVEAVEEASAAGSGGSGARTTATSTPAINDYTDDPNVSGYVRFDLFPKNPLPAGTQELVVSARISMDDSHLAISKALPVGCDNRFPARWQHAMKILYYLPGDAWQQNGWGGRYVLRMPLSRSFPQQSNQLFPDVKNLPEWWLQWEAGVSKLKFRDNATGLNYNSTYIDLTPLQVLYAPRFEHLQTRPLGILAGYTASIPVQQNGGLDIRLEHNIDISVEWLNVLGRPGIAAGAGYSWRFTNNKNDDIQIPKSYGYPTLFIRHNFASGFDYTY